MFSLNVNIKELILNSIQHPMIRQESGNHVRIVDAGRVIGYDFKTKSLTSVNSVYTDSYGNLISAHPGFPSRK
jgi:hypothetical protein